MTARVDAAIVFTPIEAPEALPGKRCERTISGRLWIWEKSGRRQAIPLVGTFKPQWIAVKPSNAALVESLKINDVEQLLTGISARFLWPPRPQNALDCLSLIRGEDRVSLTVVPQAPGALVLELVGFYIHDTTN